MQRLAESKESATWNCNQCGKTIEPIPVEIIEGEPRYIKRAFCDCPGGKQQQERAATESDYTDWKNNALEIIKNLDVGRYVDYRFGNWERKRCAGQAAQWADAVELYVSNVASVSQNWLYLYGGYGLGKTHLAVAAIRKISAINLWKLHIIVWPELCQKTKESWHSDYGDSEGKLWGEARAAKILLVDDLDKTSTSTWAMEKLFALINHRYDYKKATIITANHSLSDLKKAWNNSDSGLAVLSRIAGQLYNAIQFAGKDTRWE